MEDIVRLSHLIDKPAPTACPGCGHLLFFRLIRECLDELGITENAIHANGIGCTGVHRAWQNHGYVPLTAHGRAAAVATGIKCTNPDTFVYTFQGDGDASVIGLSETLNAAYRNENFCVFVSTNSVFALTGGQMSWETLPGQKTTTSPLGRDCGLTGNPLHLPELICEINPNVAYAARGTISSPKHIIQLKRMVKNAMEAQLAGEGYSIVECMSACPNNWHLTPLECREHIEKNVLPEFPVGEFKKRGAQA